MQNHNNLIDELNGKHAVVMVGGKCQVMNFVTDPITEHDDITFSSIADFRNRYSNRFITLEKRVMPLARVWLESPLRKQYDGVIFDPTKETNGFYNLWKGFAVEPKQGDWEMMKDHIYDIICNGNAKHAQYLMAWLAHIVQINSGKLGAGDGKRAGTSVVLRGAQGSGKGCFASPYGSIFGQHFRHLTNQKHLAGAFNAHFKDAIMVYVDEGFWAGDKAAEGVIKGLITEETLLMEAKGKDAFNIKNNMNFIMASNNEWIVPAGLSERRFFVLDVSDRHAGDRKYFNKLFDQMNNGGREALLYDLLNMDISGVDLRTIPRTEALLDQMLASMDTVQGWWFECLDSEIILEKDDMWSMQETIKDVYGAYLHQCDRRKIRHPIGNASFGKQLRKYCPNITRTYPRDTGYRHKCYQFPSLSDCRKAFEKITKMDIWKDET